MGGKDSVAADRAAVALQVIKDPEGLRVLEARHIKPDEKLTTSIEDTVQQIRARQLEAADMRL